MSAAVMSCTDSPSVETNGPTSGGGESTSTSGSTGSGKTTTTTTSTSTSTATTSSASGTGGAGGAGGAGSGSTSSVNTSSGSTGGTDSCGNPCPKEMPTPGTACTCASSQACKYNLCKDPQSPVLGSATCNGSNWVVESAGCP